MKRLLFVTALALGGCTTPLNPTMLSDAQLLVSGLTAVDDVLANLPGVPVADTALAGAVLAAMQTGLTGLQNGAKTPADFAALAQTEVNAIAPTLLADLKANQTIVTGVTLVENLLPVILAEAMPSTTPKAGPVPPDVARAQLGMWVRAPK